MWEFRCGVYDVPCESVSLLERHNDCPKHIGMLKKLNMFSLLELYEFVLLSRPIQEIFKEDKCLKIIYHGVPRTLGFGVLYVAFMHILSKI